MNRILVFIMVAALSACASFGDKGTLSEAEIAAQEAEQFRQAEAARAEKERKRRAAMSNEERERYDAMTDEGRERYNAMTDEERERYNAMTDEERERYDAMTDEARERYDAMTDEERARYDAMTDEERERYDAMTDEERARYNAMTDEEREQYDAMTDAERARYNAMTDEEREQYHAQIAEEKRQEEMRRQDVLAQMEALRQQRMEDGDDDSLIGMVTEEELRQADPLLLEQNIYFDFDQYSVHTKYVRTIAAHARFLISHPTVKIFVEGNCDDRGSPEYNVALGQRRSDSVQRALLALGVPPRQIEAVSFGAERPVAYGQTEESWARNRRADIAYPMLN